MSQLFVEQWFFLKKLILLNVICVGWVLSIMFYCLRSRSILTMHASFYRFLENRFFGSWRSLDLVLTLTLGWKNEKRPSGPTELDLEAGNLVSSYLFISFPWTTSLSTWYREFSSLCLTCVTVSYSYYCINFILQNDVMIEFQKVLRWCWYQCVYQPHQYYHHAIYKLYILLMSYMFWSQIDS